MECQHTLNLDSCTCTATSCPRHGICCECLRNHLAHRQLPRCVFPPDIEVPDRSFDAFAKLVNSGQA